MRTPLVLALAALQLGCVQLIAFDQPLIGQPDVIEGPASRGDVLCDEEIALGTTAACDVSCTLEEGDTEHACGERLEVGASALRFDPTGLHEVELTFTICGALEAPIELRAVGGGRLVMAARGLRFEADDELVAEEERFLPEEDEECVDRTLLFQDARLELVERGQRWCSEALPPFDARWTIGAPRGAYDAIELCLRTGAQ